jgi:small subunit ribosomal protein S16
LIKIRLQRKGRIRRPIYHIVVADSRSPRDGRIIEQVGRYDGVTEKKETVLNEDRIMYWLNTGAQPTDSVRKILRQEGLLYKRHLMMWGKSEAEIESALAEWKAHKDSKKTEEITHRDQVKAALAAEEKEYKSQASKNAAAVEEAPAEEPAAVEEAVEEAPAAVEEEAEEAPAEEPAAVEEAPAEEPAATEVAKTSTDMGAKEAAEYIAATNLADLEGFVTNAEERKTVLAAWEAKKAE